MKIYDHTPNTKMKTEEAKLLCRFMDCWNGDPETFELGTNLPFLHDRWFDWKEMKFDISWDWLMPVVIICHEIGDAKEREFPEDKDLDNPTGWRAWSYRRVRLSTDLKQTYKNVVNFINWYNEQKNHDQYTTKTE